MFKKFTVVILIFLCGASSAKDVWIPVNDNVLLSDVGYFNDQNIFQGYLLIKQSINFTVIEAFTNFKISQDFTPDDKKKDFKSLREIENGKFYCGTKQKRGRVQTVDAPHLARIIFFNTDRRETVRQFLIALDLPKEDLDLCENFFFGTKTFDDAYLPLTVGEFRKAYGKYFDILIREPYPDMDKDIVVDIEMKKITSVIESKSSSPGDYKRILPSFYYLETKLDDLPESFYYYFIEVLAKQYRLDLVKVRATDYIKKYGKSGKYYTQVIKHLNFANQH
jgi:hypothetical protein